MKFVGDKDAFRQRVHSLGIAGKWAASDESKECFRADVLKVIINWWPKTGTVQVQGKDSDAYKEKIQAVLEGDSFVASNPKNQLTIFIVHGHDKDARDQLELMLRRLNLNPFILQNSDGGGNTIIEALEQNIIRGTAFGIVLLTPDDMGYPKNSEEDIQHRARQNVILEMGMMMASLGRKRMAILKKGNLEIPSDTDGMLRLEFNENVVEVGQKLIGRLQQSGIKIDQNLIPEALSG